MAIGTSTRRFLPLALALAAAGAPAAAQAEFHEVRGVVVDGDGRPVADVAVATYWDQRDGALVPRGGARTDAEGRFTVRLGWAGRAHSLMALDAGTGRGARALLGEGSWEAPLTLELVPLTTVRGRLHCVDREVPRLNGSLSVTADDAIIGLAVAMGIEDFALALPPGDYRFRFSAEDCVAVRRSASLPAGGGEVDLGTIELKATVLAHLYGKPVPEWTVTDARGVDPGVTLEDYRGKWVLLEFWGYW